MSTGCSLRSEGAAKALEQRLHPTEIGAGLVPADHPMGALHLDIVEFDLPGRLPDELHAHTVCFEARRFFVPQSEFVDLDAGGI